MTGHHHHRRSERIARIRTEVAALAARLIAADGLDSYANARDKAALRLGVSDRTLLPHNDEIEAALHAYRELFQATTHHATLTALRRAAAEAMRALAAFHPRLVGPVLSGTAHAHSVIELHLFAEPPEAVGFFLIDAGRRFQTATRSLRWRTDEVREYPAFDLDDGAHRFALTVFPIDGQRQAPSSPVDGRPMPRATLAEVEKLIAG